MWQRPAACTRQRKSSCSSLVLTSGPELSGQDATPAAAELAAVGRDVGEVAVGRQPDSAVDRRQKEHVEIINDE